MPVVPFNNIQKKLYANNKTNKNKTSLLSIGRQAPNFMQQTHEENKFKNQQHVGLLAVNEAILPTI